MRNPILNIYGHVCADSYPGREKKKKEYLDNFHINQEKEGLQAGTSHLECEHTPKLTDSPDFALIKMLLTHGLDHNKTCE